MPKREGVAEEIRQRLGLTLEEKTTARGTLLVVQSAIIPPDSGIKHDPESKIRCGDVLCRVDGQDIRFMNFAEAGHLLLKTASKISLGFVSAVQRGYEIVATREPSTASKAHSPKHAEPGRRPDRILARLDAEISHLQSSTEDGSCCLEAVSSTNSSAKSDDMCATPSSLQSEKGQDHAAPLSSETMASTSTTAVNSPPKSAEEGSERTIEEREEGCQTSLETPSRSTKSLEDELRSFYVHYAPSKVVQVAGILAAHPEYRDPAVLNAILREKYGADLNSFQCRSAGTHKCADPTREQQSLIKQLLDQNQTLINSLHEVRDKLNAAETRADSMEDAARNAERRAKAAEARLAVIKSELGSLKEQGKLEEPATKIHDSMLTPRHIPERPLLQHRKACGVPHTQHAQHVTGTVLQSGHHGEAGRTANFAYMACLGAYPQSNAGLEMVEDPLAVCPQPALFDTKTMNQAPPLLPTWNDSNDSSLNINAYISQGDMLEARLLGVSHSQMESNATKQLQFAKASFVGGHVASNGQSGQLAIAFVSDIVPAWTGAGGGQTHLTSPASNASADMSYDLSNSPRWTPTDTGARIKGEAVNDQIGSPAMYAYSPRQKLIAQSPSRQIFVSSPGQGKSTIQGGRSVVNGLYYPATKRGGGASTAVHQVSSPAIDQPSNVDTNPRAQHDSA